MLHDSLDQLFGLDIDLFFIYSGHNEFLNFIYVPSMETAENNQVVNAVKKMRLSQFISYQDHQLQSYIVNKKLLSKDQIANFVTKPKSFSVDNEHHFTEKERKLVYQKYKENIEDMISEIQQRKKKVLIGTVAYNRRAMPWQQWQTDDLSIFRKEFNECEDLYKQKQYSLAGECYESVIESDDLPVRSNNIMNSIVKQIAVEKNIPLVDIDQAIVNNSYQNIPDGLLFSDHCHLNDQGNEILMKEVANAISKEF